MKGRKTPGSGRKKGTPNKKKHVVIPPLEPSALEKIEQGLLKLSAKTLIRLPKHVMIDAMLQYENLGRALLAKAERLAKKTNANLKTIEDIAKAGHKYISQAVDVAAKVAPYVHARLLAVESRGSMTEDEPFVVRVPSVASDSLAWQAACLAEAAELEAAPAIPGCQDIIPPTPVFTPAVTSGNFPRVLPEEASPTTPATLVASSTSRITAMPAGPVTIRPSGTQEWLDAGQRGTQNPVVHEIDDAPSLEIVDACSAFGRSRRRSRCRLRPSPTWCAGSSSVVHIQMTPGKRGRGEPCYHNRSNRFLMADESVVVPLGLGFQVAPSGG